MIPGNEDGKIGFLMTVMALIALVGSFAGMALAGTSELLQLWAVGSVFAALFGHFVFGGGEYREKMLEKKRKDRK